MANELTITLKNVRIEKLTITGGEDTLQEFLASLTYDTVSQERDPGRFEPEKPVQAGSFKVFW